LSKLKTKRTYPLKSYLRKDKRIKLTILFIFCGFFLSTLMVNNNIPSEYFSSIIDFPEPSSGEEFDSMIIVYVAAAGFTLIGISAFLMGKKK
jgi:hypothetical protein